MTVPMPVLLRCCGCADSAFYKLFTNFSAKGEEATRIDKQGEGLKNPNMLNKYGVLLGASRGIRTPDLVITNQLHTLSVNGLRRSLYNLLTKDFGRLTI